MRYKIKVNIEIEECKYARVSAPEMQEDGSFEMTISEEEAIDIDKCEKALLETSYPTIRETMSRHLTNISEKKALEKGSEEDLVINSHPYQVDGEVGRFIFTTHSIISDGSEQYNTAHDLFPELKGKEWYRTSGFKEIAFVYGSCEQSYRKTSELINRTRHQPGATPSRTLRDNTEAEGAEIIDFIEIKAKEILEENEFTPEGEYKGDKKKKKYGRRKSHLPKSKIQKAIESCCDCDEIKEEIRNNPVGYENPEKTVNISMDDVGVKEQKSHRKRRQKDVEKLQEKKKRKYVHNTIVHVEKGEKSYVLNGYGIINVLRLLIAFLLHNNLLKHNLLFFIDGHKILLDSILRRFAWFKNITIILDWYHLEKKLKEQLSLAMKGRDIRNAILKDVSTFLWYGLVDSAVEYLRQIDKNLVKNEEALQKLITYLQRNTPYIPCYAVRKILELRNSSNIGEKMNDLLVSERQKHNGMSWSRNGSVALASITALVRNGELERWLEINEIEFRFAA